MTSDETPTRPRYSADFGAKVQPHPEAGAVAHPQVAAVGLGRVMPVRKQPRFYLWPVVGVD
jgi:hypothetical protein